MGLVDDALLDAIALHESENNPAAIGDLNLEHQAYGAYQMRLPAYQDVQRLYPKEFGAQPFERLMGDATFQRLAARRYLEALESHYGIRDLDRLIAGYNAGPKVRHGRPLTNMDYVQKVRKRMKKGSPVLQGFHHARP